MAYASWSLTFGEQPSTAKWNILGTNDDAFNIQVGSLFGSGTTSAVWWEELGRTTLSGSADSITVSSFPQRRYLQLQIFVIATGGTVGTSIACNADTGANYARRSSTNGAADTTDVSQAGSSGGANISLIPAAENMWIGSNVINVATSEKIFISTAAGSNTAGAANAPTRRETVLKWANTAAAITTLSVTNTGTGDYASGSEMVILGHD